MLKEIDEHTTVSQSIDRLVLNASLAATRLEVMNQEQVDQAVAAMARAAHAARGMLAAMAVEETGRGNYRDKVAKNDFAAKHIYDYIKDDKTVGIINDDPVSGVMKVAEPVGIIAGVTPVTNPTSTVIFNAMLALKTRNPIIFGFHPFAQKSCVETGKIIRDAAVAAGAPKDWIQWIKTPSLEATNTLMNHPGVATIIATGGAGMVKTAYSTGKPALGVGPGNVPCFIEQTADVHQAVSDVVTSKSFDNGMICASESNLIVADQIYDQVKTELSQQGVYFVGPDNFKALEATVMNLDKQAVDPKVAGQTPWQIAQWAGFDVPSDTKVLAVELPSIGGDQVLSREKLSPVLAVVHAKDTETGFNLMKRSLSLGGLGHTAALHTTDEAVMNKFALEMTACRALINVPSSQGAIGYKYDNVAPSLTLGCGTWGHNSISHNLEDWDLLNIKTVAKRLDKIR
ncbi:acetaldehyde dehydrogenase [Lactiplantibacillus pentosus]|uniref:aldehyde dehydrogenase family protein n=1 Tax=Lactiplantibacillus pentosus TaxID=1589 RepID=UPI000D014F43|nr:aldehyde dehydrogenase family protein [Lactiplantibacillus pentosus]PRO83452.1 acetaldehyde dehydrogenase [Lactiplantibacillus pentosus]